MRETRLILLGLCDPSWYQESRHLLASDFSSHLRNLYPCSSQDMMLSRQSTDLPFPWVGWYHSLLHHGAKQPNHSNRFITSGAVAGNSWHSYFTPPSPPRFSPCFLIWAFAQAGVRWSLTCTVQNRHEHWDEPWLENDTIPLWKWIAGRSRRQ